MLATILSLESLRLSGLCLLQIGVLSVSEHGYYTMLLRMVLRQCCGVGSVRGQGAIQLHASAHCS
jgi:hypothetical protein